MLQLLLQSNLPQPAFECSLIFFCSYLRAEEAQHKRVGLQPLDGHGAVLQPVGVRRPSHQVALAIQGGHGLRGLGVVAEAWTGNGKKRGVNLRFCVRRRPKRRKGQVQAPGSMAYSQDTPSRPPAGRWVMLVTRHASSVGSAVAWGLRTGSRVKAKVGSGREEEEESKLSFVRLRQRDTLLISAGENTKGVQRGNDYPEFPLIFLEKIPKLFHDFPKTLPKLT